MTCWICGGEANSREHLIKASDLKAVFRRVSQRRPLYFHTSERRNRIVQGIGSNALKFSTEICHTCNTTRTQAHDRAWEQLSTYLRASQHLFRPGDRIRLRAAFPGAVWRSMLAVHLYFVKVFGCQIAEHQIPIDLKGFSRAIIEKVAHPKLHLAFCPPVDTGPISVGGTDMMVAKLRGSIVFVTWCYILDKFLVRVMYAEPGERRQGLVDSWHPSRQTKLIRVSRN